MSTKKLRIQGYLPHDTYDSFEQERSVWGISQSQALDRILSERYQSNIASSPASDRDLMPLITSINELRLQVSTLEHELEDRLLSKLESKLLSNLLSKLPSNSLGNLDSELDLGESKSLLRKESLKDKWDRELGEKYLWEDGCFRIKQADGTLKVFCGSFGSVSKKYNTCRLFDSLTDSQFRIDIDRLALPHESLSELESVTSESSSELESVTSESSSELESVTSELPSELRLSKGLSQRDLAKRLNCSHPYIKELAIAGNLPEWSRREDPQGIGWELRGKKYYPIEAAKNLSESLPGDKETFVVYEFDKATNQYRYWSGNNRMFDNSLHHACKYKSEETASKSLSLIDESEAYLKQLKEYEAGRFTLGYETMKYLAAHRLVHIRTRSPA